MTYPVISSRRMPYDIDGTEIAVGSLEKGITGWATSQGKADANGHTLRSNSINAGEHSMVIWTFLPEEREIEQLFIRGNRTSSTGSTHTLASLKASNDTHNGLDGTWESAVFPSGVPGYSNLFSWRDEVKPVSLSQPYKTLRFEFTNGTVGSIDLLHLYGAKAATETPDDILILDNSEGEQPEFTALKDWGNRPEGTMQISSIRLQNDSSTKTANDVNIQLNHDDFLISWSNDGSWTTFLDIDSMNPGAVSSPIYIKHELSPPLLLLGPRAARVIVNVGSWTT